MTATTQLSPETMNGKKKLAFTAFTSPLKAKRPHQTQPLSPPSTLSIHNPYKVQEPLQQILTIRASHQSAFKLPKYLCSCNLYQRTYLLPKTSFPNWIIPQFQTPAKAKGRKTVPAQIVNWHPDSLNVCPIKPGFQRPWHVKDEHFIDLTINAWILPSQARDLSKIWSKQVEGEQLFVDEEERYDFGRFKEPARIWD